MKIDYTDGEACLHLTYQDTLDMTKEDAIAILEKSVKEYHAAKTDSDRLWLPRARMIRAYEIAIEAMRDSKQRDSEGQ